MTGAGSLAAWLRLTLAPGVGGVTQRTLLKTFGLPEAIFSAPRQAVSAAVGERSANALLDADSAAAVDAALGWLEEPGNHILTLADSAYPQAILDITDPPALIYVQGDTSLLQRPSIAIVGSRNASPGGKQTAERFAAALGRAGWLISSGLALGIDAAAHEGALNAGEPTLAFIGTGADRVYPARHRELAHRIVEHGAIVSEYRLGTPAIAANFPRRNRLIAGHCRGVLVVEAAMQSGSLITARLAAEAGREVFAVPGSIHSPLSKGCHALIRQGAKLVETVEDILEELGGVATAQAPPPRPTATMSPESTGVLTALGHDPCQLDELARRTGLTADALLAILFELELTNRVASRPGGVFQRLD